MKKAPKRSTAKKRRGARAASIKKATPSATAKKVAQPRKSEPREKQDGSRILKKERDEALTREAALSKENARLLTELRESFDRQTATAEVLGVISASPGDLGPVFETMLANAMRLCDAPCGYIYRVERGRIVPVAERGVPPAYSEFRRNRPHSGGPGTMVDAMLATRRPVHAHDARLSESYRNRNPNAVAGVELGGARTNLYVPMLRDDELIGVINVYRQEDRPFADAQIALLENFARQAVIAIENARLLTELRESLDQQTATAEVLGVISSSPGDLGPVFKAMLQNATRLCAVAAGTLYLYDGEAWRVATTLGMPLDFTPGGSPGSLHAHPETGLGRVARTRETVHIPDLPVLLEKLADPVAMAAVADAGVRSLLVVPMLRNDDLVGAISLYRSVVRAFSHKEIALVENFARQAVIAIENARLLSELRESLDRQTATSELLGVISSSPSDLQPVFTTLLDNVMRLSGAEFGGILRLDNGLLYLVADHGGEATGHNARFRAGVRPSPGMALGRVLAEKRTVYSLDLAAERIDSEGAGIRASALAELGVRTALHVPLLKDGQVIGIIYIHRREVRAFSDTQIELVENFARQAVIAIENARLLNELRSRTDELREALEQQTAMSEVLGVISASPGELQPVFQSMLANALHLCEAQSGVLLRYDADCFETAAVQGIAPEFAAVWLKDRFRMPPETNMGRMLATRQVIHDLDLAASPGYLARSPMPVAGVEVGGVRTSIHVPLLKDGAVVGAFIVLRTEVRAFSEKQIDLLRNFAAQAVIAIENARLLSELRESLDRQTATSEVLGAISASPAELHPVFETMLENAVRLCEATRGGLWRVEGDLLEPIARRGLSDEIMERHETGFRPDPDSTPGQMLRSKATVHTHDTATLSNPVSREAVELGSIRTALWVPMVKDQSVVAAFALNRGEVRPFSNKQIELVENFAAQAVIAIENARLLTELRESLDRQTATSEVLGAISASPGELEPVFDIILENAMRLCDAKFGILFRYEDGRFHTGARKGVPLPFAESLNAPQIIGPNSILGSVERTRESVAIEDVASTPAYTNLEPGPVAAVELGGVRSLLFVPMLKENELVGVISIYRQEVRPYEAKHVELLKNFAAQAVIAIENARLLTELRESLDRQTATSEVLGVISASPGELQPVFDAMLANAVRLCESQTGILLRYDGDAFYSVASLGIPPEFETFWQGTRLQMPPESNMGRMLTTKKLVHDLDLATSAGYLARHHAAVAGVELGGIRSVLSVPMLKDEAVVGAFILWRTEVRAYSDKQIALVENFAAQAVIAIENVRLLTELRARTEELTESLKRQTATSEVLSVISASPGELQPVFESMLDNAVRLCDASQGGIWRVENGDELRLIAHRGFTPEFLARRAPRYRHPPNSPPGRMLRSKRTVHVGDLAAYAAEHDDQAAREMIESAGTHAALLVPLLKDGEVVGGLSLNRQEASPFTDKQIELVENFAKQAVIAIENVRLLSELRESLDRQTATADVLRVIASTPGDPTRALDTIAETAARMFDASSAGIRRLEGGILRYVAISGPEAIAVRETVPDMPLDSSYQSARSVRENRQFQGDSDTFRVMGEMRRQGRHIPAGTVAFTPLAREGEAIGVMSVIRREFRPFSDSELELMRGFADQAVIAIENARLLSELRESLAQQTATSDVLGVISASPGDAAPVFDTIVENVLRVCEADMGTLFRANVDGLQLAAIRGALPTFEKYLRERGTYRPPPDSLPGLALHEGRPVHIVDTREWSGYRAGEPGAVAAVEIGGQRTLLAVPLLKDEGATGLILIYRHEVRPFTDKQIALVENFAAQAVIAIENARLLTELRESLDRQTATADILRVIASTPGDPTRALDTIAETAARMFDAASVGIRRVEANVARNIAAAGPSALSMRRTMPEVTLESSNPAYVCVTEKRQIDFADVQTTPWTATFRKAQQVGGAEETAQIHSQTYTPLMREEEVIGFMVVSRTEVRPFRLDELELMRGFADQAVIAIENARLLTELRESLDRQTATSDVLRVISSSPSDVDPVFDAILENAVRLCEADMGHVHRIDGETLRLIATRGASEEYDALIRQRGTFRPDARSAMVQTIREKAPLMVDDLREHPNYIERLSGAVAMVETAGVRTLLQVPVVKDGDVVGLIVVYRREVRPFTQKHVELVENFAAQAVIAIENARLLTELRESLDRQTATADILRVIASTPGNSSRALDKIAETAVRMFNASSVSLRRVEDGRLRSLAAVGPASEAVRAGVGDHEVDVSFPAGRAFLENRQIHIADNRLRDDPAWHAMRSGNGPTAARSSAFTPLIREGRAIGVMIVHRAEPSRAFEPHELELMRGFADQAVIAIENARLLTELRDRTEELARRQAELRVTFDNMGDGVAMFDSEQKLVSWNRNLQEILDIPNSLFAEPRTYRDWIAFLISRGEFGAVDFETEWPRYEEMIGQRRRVERVRPDGRVLEIRINPVPGGSFVAIYGDITERKRAEEQIRVARDAAEHALTELKAAQANLIQAEKMASLGQLTAGIAHEIKNPLNFVNNFAGLSIELLGELKEEAQEALAVLSKDKRTAVDEVVEMLTSNLEKIAEHGKRADGIVRSMLAHSRGGSGERQSVNINALVEESLNLAYHGARAQDQNFNITLERDLDATIGPIELVPQDITRVFLNLFGNGFYAANKRGKDTNDPSFKPVLNVTTRDVGGDVEIRIRDNGIGIPPDIRDRLFQPFFTTKPTGEGTGLGLSISYEIVTQQHGGTIDVDSRVGEYTEFTIRLPRRFGATARPNTFVAGT